MPAYCSQSPECADTFNTIQLAGPGKSRAALEGSLAFLRAPVFISGLQQPESGCSKARLRILLDQIDSCSRLFFRSPRWGRQMWDAPASFGSLANLFQQARDSSKSIGTWISREGQKQKRWCALRGFAGISSRATLGARRRKRCSTAFNTSPRKEKTRRIFETQSSGKSFPEEFPGGPTMSPFAQSWKRLQREAASLPAIITQRCRCRFSEGRRAIFCCSESLITVLAQIAILRPRFS